MPSPSAAILKKMIKLFVTLNIQKYIKLRAVPKRGLPVFKMVHLCIKKLTKPESLVSDYFILIKEDRVPLHTHKMRGGF